MNRLIFQNFSQKIWEKFLLFGSKFGPKIEPLVYEWVTFSLIVGICIGSLLNSQRQIPTKPNLIVTPSGATRKYSGLPPVSWLIWYKKRQSNIGCSGGEAVVCNSTFMGYFIWNPYTPCGSFTARHPQRECDFQMDWHIKYLHLEYAHLLCNILASYTPRTLRACCSQSKLRILKICESSARALFLYNCTPNISRSAEASVRVA